MCPEDKVHTAERVDRLISAEIPDPQVNPRLHHAVITHMMHGPCGKGFARKPCMQQVGSGDEVACSKNFPKEFQAATLFEDDSYPIYRRRRPEDGGRVHRSRHRNTDGKIEEVARDNRWVVPYNPTLLLKFQSHLNVEAIRSIHCVKYLYK